jgi:hypothetical protein
MNTETQVVDTTEEDIAGFLNEVAPHIDTAHGGVKAMIALLERAHTVIVQLKHDCASHKFADELLNQASEGRDTVTLADAHRAT